MLNYHNFWSSFGSSKLTVSEFGGGPSIYLLISASPFVSEIVFAEFLEANRREDEVYMSPFFKHVVQKLEGRSEENIIKCEKELRQK